VSRIAPPWLADKSTQRLLAAFAAAGIEARFVGGCVRDALLGLDGGDIDLATPARTEAVVAALTAARIRTMPTGLAHGTVTALVQPHHFEITTLRRDVETDGRHARVAFDAGWAEDAARRDFTINAIYLSADGTLYDPVGGRADLAARRVRFVGDPAMRIAEDVLRLLRYYRFEARFGDGDGDDAARAACRAAVEKLPTLSAERISQELMRLLALPDPTRALGMMREDGVLAAILPEATRLDRLQALIALSSPTLTFPHLRGRERDEAPQRPPFPPAGEGRGGGWPIDPILRLAALVETEAAGADGLGARLRLSSAERKRLAGLARPWPPAGDGDDRAQRRALHDLGAARYRDLALLRAAEGALTSERLRELLDGAVAWTPKTFSLNGGDVAALGIPPGPRVGQLLRAVRKWWEDGDFAADRAQCLEKLAELAGSVAAGR
jgi:poly(A) polymerase